MVVANSEQGKECTTDDAHICTSAKIKNFQYDSKTVCDESSSLKMKIILNFLVILVTLHSCSAFYGAVLSEVMRWCPQQNEKIMELAQECQKNLLGSFHIMSHDTDEQLYQGYQIICRNPEQIKIRKECIEKMELLLDPCLNRSNKELFESIANVMVKINKEFCEVDDIKVNSTITKIVAATSGEGLDCIMVNWRHALACTLPTIKELLEDHEIFITEMIKGSKRHCNIANEAKQCFHKTFSKCEFKAPLEVSKIYFDFILNIFDCQTAKGYGLFIAIFALIIMCSAAGFILIHKRR
ncbi:unnamed protein product [Diamesa hyperborea]